jgi:PDZ domain-containing protein
LPGRALDLGDVISLPRVAPQTHLYLTDVRFATRVTALELLSAFVPGVRVVWTGDVLPRGITVAQFDNVQREAMSESQVIAAAVAERAAGLPVPLPRGRVMVLYFAPHSFAARFLRPLDWIAAINGRPVASSSDVSAVMRGVKPGAAVRVDTLRAGAPHRYEIPTSSYRGRTVLGTYLTTIFEQPRLPVAVSYHLPRVAGSSGGLMFALEIYRSLKRAPLPAGTRIAGTGTIAYDGSVGPIEGAAQKIAAARAAGATLFLVPLENYPEIRGTPGIRVVPVATFAQALKAIATSTVPQ